jgi:hypothetical protein
MLDQPGRPILVYLPATSLDDVADRYGHLIQNSVKRQITKGELKGKSSNLNISRWGKINE